MFKFFLKSFLIIIFIGVSVLYGLLWYVPGSMSQSSLKEQMATMLAQSFGAQNIKIKGRVGFQVVPRFLIEANDVTFDKTEDGVKSAVDVEKFFVSVSSLDMLGGSLDGNFSVIINGNEFNGTAVVTNLSAYQSDGVSKIDLHVSSPFELAADAKVSLYGQTFALEDAKIRLNNTTGRIRGAQKTSRTEAGTVVGSYELKADFDVIDVNELIEIANLFPPVVSAEISAKNVDGNGDADSHENLPLRPFNEVWSDEKYDVDVFKQSLADIDVKIDELHYKKTVVKDALFSVKLEDQIFTLKGDVAEFYNGSIKLDSSVVLVDDVPSVTSTVALKKINVGQLLGDVEYPRAVKAVVDLSIDDVAARGFTPRDMIADLDGKIHLAANDASVDISDVAAGELKKIMMYFVGAGNEIDIRSLISTFVIKNGEVSNDNFKVDNSLSSLAGHGVLNLNSGQIKYKLDPKTLELAGGIGVKAPMQISGDVREPEVAIRQMDAILQNVDQLGVLENKQVKKLLGGKGAEKVKETVDKLLGGGTSGKLLNGFLGQ
jgi:hypothetical protein